MCSANYFLSSPRLIFFLHKVGKELLQGFLLSLSLSLSLTHTHTQAHTHFIIFKDTNF